MIPTHNAAIWWICAVSTSSSIQELAKNQHFLYAFYCHFNIHLFYSILEYVCIYLSSISYILMNEHKRRTLKVGRKIKHWRFLLKWNKKKVNSVVESRLLYKRFIQRIIHRMGWRMNCEDKLEWRFLIIAFS